MGVVKDGGRVVSVSGGHSTVSTRGISITQFEHSEDTVSLMTEFVSEIARAPSD